MAGLLPIMRSHGTGAELMQRIAVPMIGGMVSNNSRSIELRDELAPLRVERGLLLLRCGISARLATYFGEGVPLATLRG